MGEQASWLVKVGRVLKIVFQETIIKSTAFSGVVNKGGV